MEQQRTLRVGMTAILCALLLRLFAAGAPQRLMELLRSPDTAAFLFYLETGRRVRFSPSLEEFVPDFVESPPAAQVIAPEAPLPSFSDAAQVQISDMAGKEPDVEALLLQPLIWSLRGEEPTVLILHTHATESYTKAGESYRETANYRTLEGSYNMLSIGEYVQQLLAERGITAVQDRQLHDYPAYNGSYTHARSAIRQYLEDYPSIRLVLDLHRDASGSGTKQLRTLAQVEGEPCAQLMLVLGGNHKGYTENLSLGLKLQAQLELLAPGITRPLQLRASRFNQDLCPGALLVEVGAAGNTRAEALGAAEVLVRAIAALAEGTAEVSAGEG